MRFFALIPLAFALPMQAATISAASCSREHVEAALTLAQAGDTVTIPAGICNWSQQLTWTAPPNVTVIGAGDQSVLGGGGKTVIIDDYASSLSLLGITTSGGTFRLSGITFKGGNVGAGNLKSNGMVQVFGGAQTRIDHVEMILDTWNPPNNARGFVVGFDGVIDHSHFKLWGVAQGVTVYGPGHPAWAEPTAFGSSHFVYVEDNDFFNDGNGVANDCYMGGKWNFRRNNLHNSGVQTHSTAGGNLRGCRATELYQNNFYASDADPGFNVYWLTSGTSLIWGNDASHGFQHFLSLHSMRRNEKTYQEAPPPASFGYCGNEVSGQISNWDGNTDAKTGYPCMDQPGQGQGDLLSGDFPNIVNATRGCDYSQSCANPRQALEPIYEWLNIWAPPPGWAPDKLAIAESDTLLANRDYYASNPSFNGTSGTGSGPIASRPTTCTKGVFYWATDVGEWDTTHPGPDGEGYQCSAPNTWTLYYRPYAYPHPLITGIAPTPPETGTPQPIAADLSAVKVYPNPWRRDRHAAAPVKFSNFTGQATVKIFTTSGYEVKSLSGHGSVTWNLDNAGGAKVASGIYIYSMESPSGQKKRGKIAVVK